MNNDNFGQRLSNQQQALGDVQVQGDDNIFNVIQGQVVTLSQTKIIQISVDEIKTRELIQTSPYKGLDAFERQDHLNFFGRDQFILGLANEMEQTNLVLLMGASGSGKSSVVKAGLLPWLSEKWGQEFVSLTLTPDRDPFEKLYGSLLSCGYNLAQAEVAKAGQKNTLCKVVKALKQPGEFWLIFVDQFEELFTISKKEKRDCFIKGLVSLSKEYANDPFVKIVGTMRADFLGRLDSPQANQLARLTQKHRPLITQMQQDELRLAIEQPAAHHGVVFETGLVKEIIKDVEGQAGYLPLLQYTLNLLWKTEVQDRGILDRTLNLSSYRRLGGVRGALQQRVDQIYQDLPELQKLAAQRIFLKLVKINGDEAAGTEWKPVRRRANRSEFQDGQEQAVLTQLINDNLLVGDAPVEDKEKHSVAIQGSTVEIAHEILLTCWGKLNDWIEEHRQAIALRNRLNDDVVIWQKNKKADSDLWGGVKLVQVQELRSNQDLKQVLGEFSDIANQFIDVSVKLRDRQQRRTIITAWGIAAGSLVSAVVCFSLMLQLKKAKQETHDAYTNILTDLFLESMIDTQGTPGEIKFLDKDDAWKIVLKIVLEEKKIIVAARRDYGDGKVLAAAHDGVLRNRKDSFIFLKQSLGWLNPSKDKRKILISSGHCEIVSLKGSPYAPPKSKLEAWEADVENIAAPIDETKLNKGNILIIGNAWGNFTQSEIDAIEKFVKNGGSLFVVGIGWSWKEYSDSTNPVKNCKPKQQANQRIKDISTYPMNRLVKPYNIQWTEGGQKFGDQ
ncbi:DUF4350 domain-containing protein [Acaryochloris marina]|uniref:DUF4350 domain-containing protein n=1 Tax=Acaryochloris marina TaxID=155978 RepID=UPI001BB0B96A|nr:DUF4350 domain-containing protein [Acaryochloris marina]QUY45849.1 hypothetical protein I1H34_29360 [Acaryochloris marina S15]